MVQGSISTTAVYTTGFTVRNDKKKYKILQHKKMKTKADNIWPLVLERLQGSSGSLSPPNFLISR